MTPPRRGDWDDDRLAGAFANRATAGPPPPARLASDVMARVSTVRPANRLWRTFAPAAVVGALAIAIAGASILGNSGPDPSDPGASGPPASGSAGDPTQALPAGDVLDAVGNPIRVSAALAVRDSEIDQQEIAVEGFLSPLPGRRCRADVQPPNPTRLRCPEDEQWLMEDPENLWETTDSYADGTHRPSGAAFNPSFALVEDPVVPMPVSDDEAPVPVVLIGHFNDRRASSCDPSDREACDNTFVVDRVLEVNGTGIPVRTERSTATAPRDSEAGVDGLVNLVAPTVVILSRQLLPVAEVYGSEPILAIDQLIPYVDQTQLAWLVTTVDRADVPIERTFMLLDGSSWFAEIGRSVRPLERPAPGPSQGTVPLGPTAEPGAFDSVPFSVLGIKVRAVADVNRERMEDRSAYRDEYAIRGWYIAPRPGVECDPLILTVGAPGPPCDEARHWLLGDPQEYGISVGQPRANPDAPPSILNPLVPADVPFDVGETWRGDTPVPQPVIVLGHFADPRVSAVGGNEYFVIDALAWRGTDVPIDRVNRITALATEDPLAVAARIAAVSPEQALATWLTAVDAGDFARIEANAAARNAPELSAGGPVWIVRRLILEDYDPAPRFIVETGYTTDHGTRVWLAPNLDSDPDLKTSIDLQDLDANTALLQVFDYDDVVVAVGPAGGRSGLSWVETGPVEGLYEVAPGRNDREVVVRWRDPDCATSYRLDVHAYGDGAITLDPEQLGPACQGGDVWRRLVIEFDHPVDVKRFRTGDACCG